MIELEEVVCNLCGSEKSSPFFQEHGYTVVRCSQCGLVYTNPRPTLASLQTMYDEETFTATDGEVAREDSHYEAGDEGHKHIAQKTWQRLVKYQPNKQGRFLDIGCGMGHLMQTAQDAGMISEGVELSEKRVQAGREQGLTLHQGEVTELNLPAKQYDVVTGINLLSHHLDPLAFFREVARLTKSGGLVLVQTGNKAELATHRDGKALSDYWGPPEHLYWFGEKQLRQAFTQVGMEVIAVERLPYLDATLSPERLMKPTTNARNNLMKQVFLWLPPVRFAFKELYRWYFYQGRPQSSALFVFARQP